MDTFITYDINITCVDKTHLHKRIAITAIRAEIEKYSRIITKLLPNFRRESVKKLTTFHYHILSSLIIHKMLTSEITKNRLTTTLN